MIRKISWLENCEYILCIFLPVKKKNNDEKLDMILKNKYSKFDYKKSSFIYLLFNL